MTIGMTIAITGATGQLGRLVIETLKSKAPGAEIIALARSPAKAADLGISAREADYAKPETLDRALAGIETLLLISSSEIGQRSTQHRNVIDAARQASVKRIVYTSLLHADTSPPSISARKPTSRLPAFPSRSSGTAGTRRTTPAPSAAPWPPAPSSAAPATAKSPPPPAPTMPKRRSPH
jgi:NAD(P)-dependent dehydrogenase (short-subunit alcohol dehydrogenase family)